MKAVNLIPTEGKRGGVRAPTAPKGPAVGLIGLLVIALAFVTIYVLTSNTINDRKAKIATVQSEVTVAQAAAARLTNYATFVKLADDRNVTVKQIAQQRFDWNAALSDLSKVVPPNTSLESLLGTVNPSASVNGSGGGTGGAAVGTSSLRSAIQSPAFEIKGCTASQDDVARLMSRLRLINGVTRVTLADSGKQDGGSTPGAAVAASSNSSGSCPASWATFDLVIFFAPLPGQSTTGTTGTTTPTTATTTSTTTTATAGAASASSASAASPSSNAQPVSSSSPSGSK